MSGHIGNGSRWLPPQDEVPSVTAPPASTKTSSQQDRVAASERRRERWEFWWSVAILTVGVTIAIASVSACVVLHGMAEENRRIHGLEWGKPKGATDGR